MHFFTYHPLKKNFQGPPLCVGIVEKWYLREYVYFNSQRNSFGDALNHQIGEINREINKVCFVLHMLIRFSLVELVSFILLVLIRFGSVAHPIKPPLRNVL